jgi:hypothetical protein
MGERSDLPRLSITVSPTDLGRCKWCGGVLGKDTMRFIRWHRKNDHFCSDLCYTASLSRDFLGPCLFIANILASIILIINGYFIQSLPAMAIFYILGICYLREFIKGWEATSVIPKNSRSIETLTDTLILQAMTNYVECPVCHSALEFSQDADDKYYYCENCDASGIIEITLIEKED